MSDMDQQLSNALLNIDKLLGGNNWTVEAIKKIKQNGLKNSTNTPTQPVGTLHAAIKQRFAQSALQCPLWHM